MRNNCELSCLHTFCKAILSFEHECNGRVPANGSARHLLHAPRACCLQKHVMDTWRQRLGNTCWIVISAACNTGHELAAILRPSQRLVREALPPASPSMFVLRAPLPLLQRVSLRQQHCNGPGEGLLEAARVGRHGRVHSRNVVRRLVPLCVCLVTHISIVLRQLITGRLCCATHGSVSCKRCS